MESKYKGLENFSNFWKIQRDGIDREMNIN